MCRPGPKPVLKIVIRCNMDFCIGGVIPGDNFRRVQMNLLQRDQNGIERGSGTKRLLLWTTCITESGIFQVTAQVKIPFFHRGECAEWRERLLCLGKVWILWMDNETTDQPWMPWQRPLIPINTMRETSIMRWAMYYNYTKYQPYDDYCFFSHHLTFGSSMNKLLWTSLQTILWPQARYFQPSGDTR